MHRPSPLCFAVFALGLLGGCRKVEPAPKALDRLFPWFFQMIDEAEDEQLAEGFRNLHKAGKISELEDLVDGSLSDIEAAELGSAEVDAPAPNKAAGVYMLRRLKCSLPQLERALIHQAQDELYTDAYDTYDRTFTTDRSAYVEGAEDLLRWDVRYTATILGKSYESEVIGALRRVPRIDEEQSPFGDTLVARAHIPRPANFEKDGTTLEQDYQIEMYYPMGGGEVLHAYGIWREADFGAGINSDSEGSQRLLLNNLDSWDKETEKNCAEGRP